MNRTPVAQPGREAVRITLLGTPTIERQGQAVHVDTRKALALLAYLAASGGPQSRDSIAALLWSDLDDSGARAALRRTLSTVRSALDDQALAGDRRVVELRRGVVDVDLHTFRDRVETVRRHGHPLKAACPDCLHHLQAAAEIYGGDFLAGFALRDAIEFDDWQLLQAESLRRELAEILEGIVATLISRGQFTAAIPVAQRWQALDPLNEAAHRALMQLFHASGQRAAALRQYRECVRILEAELAVPPVEETTRLYQAIKESEENQIPVVDSRPAARPPDGLPHARRRPLVGRAREWEALLHGFDVASRGPHVVALDGEAGIGKTRLVQELIEYARDRRAVTLSTRCYEGETHLAYAPVIELLRAALDTLQSRNALGSITMTDLLEVARLLPDAAGTLPGQETTSSVETPGAHTRFLGAVCRVLLAAGGELPLVVSVDDLQWADDASCECLAYLLRRLGSERIAIVVAWRSEELPSSHVVRRAIAEAHRQGSVSYLRLERLGPRDVEHMVESVQPLIPPHHEVEGGARLRTASLKSDSDFASTASFAAWLYQETEGLPLFLTEYLGAIADGTWEGSIPLGVRDLLLSRLEGVSDLGWQFLTAAAIIGRSFDFDTLRETSGRDEDMTIGALEELCRQGLMREIDDAAPEGPAYDFRHDKLRALVYERTSLARRRLLHRRVAEVLVGRRRAHHDDSLAGQIARHFNLAGLPTQAADYFRKAGDRARGLFAHREALAHYEAALGLAHGSPNDSIDLLETLGDVHALLGEYRLAASRYESAAALTGGSDLARIEHKLGSVNHRWGEWELAESYYQDALGHLDKDDPAGQSRLYADWSMATYHRGRTKQAAALAETALQLADESGDARAMAKAHTMLGILENSFEHRRTARDHLSRSLELVDGLHDPEGRIAALQNLAVVSRQDDAGEAERLTREALQLAIAQGDRHREAVLHNALADILHGGDADGAMAHLKQAVAIYAEIGVEAGAVRPEVWKLTEW